MIADFRDTLINIDPTLPNFSHLRTLQVNLGNKCNQGCIHCQVQAEPDGIVENPNLDGKLYGIERFESFLQLRRALKPEALVQAISEEAYNYSKSTEQSDDRTILALRVTE